MVPPDWSRTDPVMRARLVCENSGVEAKKERPAANAIAALGLLSDPILRMQKAKDIGPPKSLVVVAPAPKQNWTHLCFALYYHQRTPMSRQIRI
jgi:hypothetical protein